MMWPFVLRRRYFEDLKVLCLRIDELKAEADLRLVEMREDRDYWKARAEKFIDAALLKRGEIAIPVMSEVPKREPPKHWFNALNVEELPRERESATG